MKRSTHYVFYDFLTKYSDIFVEKMSGCRGVDKMLNFTLKFLCDGQGALRLAILYTDRSCLDTRVRNTSLKLFLNINYQRKAGCTKCRWKRTPFHHTSSKYT